jgi:hypothetical protein
MKELGRFFILVCALAIGLLPRAEAQLDSINYSALDFKVPEIFSISTVGSIDQRMIDEIKTKTLFLSTVDSASYYDFNQRTASLTTHDKDVIISISGKVSKQRSEFMLLLMTMAEKSPLHQAYNEARGKILEKYKVLDFKSRLILKE